MKKQLLGALLLGGCLATALPGTVAMAQAVDEDTFETHVNVEILNIAEFEFTSTPLLALTVPPPGSTFPFTGVTFTVRGNAKATLVAEPDAWINIPSESMYLGKATRSAGGDVGYRISMRILGPGGMTRGMTGNDGEGTEPLTVTLSTAPSQTRNGDIHMEASHDWTEDGGLALPGLYEGTVIITVTPHA